MVDMILIEKAKVRQVLEVLQNVYLGQRNEAHYEAITALRQALEQPADEPVAWEGWKEAAIAWTVCASVHQQWAKGKDAFYTTRQSDFNKHADHARTMCDTRPQPPKRKPLTHEQRLDLHVSFEPHKSKWNAQSILIDMVEAAHGITGEQT